MIRLKAQIFLRYTRRRLGRRHTLLPRGKELKGRSLQRLVQQLPSNFTPQHLAYERGHGIAKHLLDVASSTIEAQPIRKGLQPAHLYVAYGDGLVQVAGLERLLGRRSWAEDTEAEVLLLRGGYMYGAANIHKRLRAQFSPSLIRYGPWVRIHHINPDDVAVLRRGNSEAAGRYRLMPDPIEPPSTVTKTSPC